MFLRSSIVVATLAAVLALTPAAHAQAQTSSSVVVNTKLRYTPVKIGFSTGSTNYVKGIQVKGVRVAVPKSTGTFTKRVSAGAKMTRSNAFKGVTAKKGLSLSTKNSVNRSRSAFRNVNNKVFVKSSSSRGKVR